MADANSQYLAYDSEDDQAALNDRYESIPTPAEGEELESSDEEEPVEEDDDDDELTVSESENEKPKEEENEESKLKDPDFDPYLMWDKLAGSERQLADLQELLLEDPDVQSMWQNQDDNDEPTEDEEEEEIEESDEDEEESKTAVKRSDDDEDDEELDLSDSGDESDDPKRLSTEPPTPLELDAEDGIERDESDEDEEEDFSLDEINTEPEDEDEEKDDNEKSESRVGEDEEDNDEQEEEEKGKNEDEENNEPNEEEEVEGEKPKRYRKIPKDSDDSDPTEYETITESDDEEEAEQTVVEEEKEDIIEKVVEEKPATPDPYGYTELHTNIEHIEEFDDDFDHKFRMRYQQSAISSQDESDPGLGACDVQQHSIEKQQSRKLSVVLANKTSGFTKKQQKRRRISVAQRQNENAVHNVQRGDDNTQKQKEDGTTNEREHQKSNKNPRARKEQHVINLDVYNHHNYPTYTSDEDKHQNKKSTKKNENDEKKKRKKGGKKEKQLRTRKTLESSYNRLHPWYKSINKTPRNDYPSAEIPSYKVVARSRDIKERTIELTMEKLLNQTFKAIDEIERIRRRKEAEHHSRYIVLELADNVVGEIEEVQQREAVRYALDVLLDKWEERVYETKKTLIEEQLDSLSEKLVTNAIKKSTVEVANENRVVSLVVRDALAVALNDIGKSQIRIHRKLNNMFSEYNFPEYDFNKGQSTKVKQKRHRQRKDLDVYLRERAKRLDIPFGEEVIHKNNEKNKTKKRRKKEEKNLKQIEESQETNENVPLDEKPEDEEIHKNGSSDNENINPERTQSPLFITPEHSENDSEAVIEEAAPEPEKQKLSVAEVRDIVNRSRRRSTALAVWKTEDKKILEELREENRNWNDMTEASELKRLQEEEEEDSKQKAALTDYNAMYAETSEEENKDGSEDDVGYSKEKIMPDLKKVVDEALVNFEAPVVVIAVPLGKRRRERYERPDSAIDSDREVAEPSRNRKNAVFHLPAPGDQPPPVSRHDTGISSTMTVEDHDGEMKTFVGDVLKGNSQENEMTLDTVINLIPKLDRDQYLQNWLLNGVQHTNDLKRIPTPPVKPSGKKVRQFRLKRPETAESTASIRDVIPIEQNVYRKIDRGRLNSAKSTRSNFERPESAVTCYTDRSSVYSKNGSGSSSESENLKSDEEAVKTLKNPGNKKFVKKNTKIKFTEQKKGTRQKSEEWEKMEKEYETTAWNFYMRQRRELRLLQSKIEEEGRPQLLSDVILPEKDLNNTEKQKIREKYMEAIQINGMFDGEEGEELELLKLVDRNDSNSESDKENEEDGQKAPSVEPPSTPWRRIKGRPLTPDSVDSDEELTKLKDKFYEEYQKKQNGSNKKPDRVWKEFLKKKSTALPPPPKIGWQPTTGLINWKNANADVRKEKRRKKSEADIAMNLKRNLFNQLQITVNREQKHEASKNSNRLLERRKTLHAENISLTKEQKREKLLPKNADTGNISPRSTRSIPSYLKTTKASQSKVQDVKLPKITPTSTSNKKPRKPTKSAGTTTKSRFKGASTGR